MNDENGVNKLQDHLRRKFPSLQDEEVEKISKSLYDLGVFLVRHEMKQVEEKEKRTP